jgi:hypothetical protein
LGNDVVMARPFKAPFRAPSSSANDDAAAPYCGHDEG